MASLVWTQIQTGYTKPPGRYLCSLTAISDSKLLIHGGSDGTHNGVNDTWILDIPSQTWRQYTSGQDYPREWHSGLAGINDSVMIIRGIIQLEHCKTYGTTFHIMLEPRTLQQLAMQTIYAHRRSIPWKHLPPKLIARFGFSENEEDTAPLQ